MPAQKSKIFNCITYIFLVRLQNIQNVYDTTHSLYEVSTINFVLHETRLTTFGILVLYQTFSVMKLQLPKVDFACGLPLNSCANNIG